MRTRKKMAWLLCFVTVIATVMSGKTLSVRASTTNVSFNMSISVANGTTEPENYGIDYQVVDADGYNVNENGFSGRIDKNSSSDPISFSNIDEAYKIKFTVQSAGLSIRLNGDDVTNGGWSSGKTIDISDVAGKVYNFELYNNTTNPGPEPPVNPGTDPTNPYEITVRITGGMNLLDTNGSYIMVDGQPIPMGSNQITVEQATQHTISVLCANGYAISSATINGSSVTVTPDSNGAWYTFQAVNETSSYEIKLTGGRNAYTIAWDNGGTLGSDATVTNGKVEIVPGTGITNLTQDPAAGGLYNVVPGTTVTIKLIPDYGYQLKSTDLNGATVAAGGETSTFTFTMPYTDLHLKALFEKTNDVIVEQADLVNDVSIANGGNAATSGNLKMTVTDNNTYSADVSSVVTGTNVTSVDVLDLSLQNIVSKGTAGQYWESPISSFSNPISVSLDMQLGALSEGETYSVVRDHNSTLTELDTVYNAATGTLTFETNQFSTYTIVKKKEIAVNNTTNTVNNALNSNLTNSATELADKVLDDADKAALSSGSATSADVWLKVDDISSTVSESDKNLVDGKKGTAVLGMYLDITLHKQVGTGSDTLVTSTNSAVTISLKIPDTLLNTDASKTRTYQIIRVHGGVADIIPCNFNATTKVLTFSTDKFSTYALVYTDSAVTVPVGSTGGSTGSGSTSGATKATALNTTTPQKDAVPKTGEDAFSVEGLYLLLVALGAGIIVFSKKGRVRL